MTVNVAIFISGGGSNMKALVHAIRELPSAKVAMVLSNRPDAGGIRWARENGILTRVVDYRLFGQDRAKFEAALTAELLANRIDCIFLAGFMRILTADFTSAWEGNILNIHPSLLPLYKGLHTHERALQSGDKHHGCTVHLVTSKLDDGPILGQARVPILADDTPDTLAARVLKMEHRLYPRVAEQFLQGRKDPINLSFEDEFL